MLYHFSIIQIFFISDYTLCILIFICFSLKYKNFSIKISKLFFFIKKLFKKKIQLINKLFKLVYNKIIYNFKN